MFVFWLEYRTHLHTRKTLPRLKNDIWEQTRHATSWAQVGSHCPDLEQQPSCAIRAGLRHAHRLAVPVNPPGSTNISCFSSCNWSDRNGSPRPIRLRYRAPSCAHVVLPMSPTPRAEMEMVPPPVCAGGKGSVGVQHVRSRGGGPQLLVAPRRRERLRDLGRAPGPSAVAAHLAVAVVCARQWG